MYCDFCNGKPPRWRYPCRTFTASTLSTPLFVQQSLGDWAACDSCYALIEAGNIAELTNRSMDLLVMSEPSILLVYEQAAAHMAALHAEFMQDRCGPVVLIEAEVAA
jgi:hypothetical protein